MKKHIPRKALSVVQQYFPNVDTVKDAKADLTIEVTNKDNNSAAVLDHHACALAVACKRAMKADGVIIGTRTAYVIYGNVANRYRLLETTSREIVSFDRRGGFHAGLYPLKAPYPSERLGIRRSGPKTVTGKKNKPMRHFTAKIRTVLGHAGVTRE